MGGNITMALRDRSHGSNQ